MPALTWDRTFETGIDQFDQHHRHMVDLFNQTYDDFVAGTGQAVGTVLDELADYAVYHFNAEEQWMDRCGYGRKDQHCEEHARFARRVSEFQRCYHDGEGGTVTVEVLSFLRNWLTQHILVTDADYGRTAHLLINRSCRT